MWFVNHALISNRLALFSSASVGIFGVGVAERTLASQKITHPAVIPATVPILLSRKDRDIM